MKRILVLAIGDFKHIFRDKTLLVFLTTPLTLLLFVRLFVPYITGVYPLLKDYHPLVMMFACLQTAIMFGFITSFLILEEKDENVLQAIRVLPISSSFFIAYRLLFATSFSFLGALFMVLWGGLTSLGFIDAILLSVQYSLAAPLITLIIATYAKNKIEGMAFFKGIDLLLIIPILSLFLTGAVRYVFGFIPVFWTYQLYDIALKGEPITAVFLIGMAIYLVVIYFLFSQFKKRVFDGMV
jgi:fluoroquinolone transport system permease protein